MINFSVVGEHRNFFRKHQWIECEELLSPKELSYIQEKIENKEIAQRDLWRQEAPLKKIVLNKSLARVAAELTETRSLRFGYDQLLILPKKTHEEPTAYDLLLQQTLSLENISSIQGVICGVMLCVQADQSAHIDEQDSPIFSINPGNGVFFTPEFPIDFTTVHRRPGCTYLMIVYVQPTSVYYSQPHDPFCRHFQQLGYQFGDRLSEQLNPLVFP